MENHFNCIYCYTNKVNGKKYVGQAVDFIKRYKQHINQAYNENNRAYNQYFHNAIRKHGIENFEIEILKENLPNQEELNYWEKFYIAEFDTLANNRKGYNIGEGGSDGNPLAGKTKEEVAEIHRKISEANKGENNPMYGKNPLTGKSDEEIAEIRRKQSEAMKGNNNGCIGEKHPRATLVDRFTLDGIYIDTKYQFEYVRMGFHNSNISSCCKGKRKTHKGYIFKYHNE